MFDFWSWISDVFEYLLPFLRKRKGTLLLLGLDGAGKTTLLGRLKNDRLTQPIPTSLPYSESLMCGNVCFTTYDIGGHLQARRVWKSYFPVADGIIFVLDGADRERFAEARVELEYFLADEQIVDVPVAILINKIDIPGAADEEEIGYTFNLFRIITGKDTKMDLQGRRPLALFPCSVKMRQGYGNALKWMAHFMR